MFTKKIKIILSTVLLALAVGYVGLYHWAKSRFTEIYQESIQQLQAEGCTIESSPLIFSGFPFRLTASQEKIKVEKHTGEIDILIESQNPKMHVSILNPFKYQCEGDTSISVTQKGLPLLKVTIGNGALELGHQRNKLTVVSASIDDIKMDIFSAAGPVQIQTGLDYEGGEYSLQDSGDGQVVESSRNFSLNKLTVMTSKDGALSPLLQLKKVKVSAKSKMPLSVVDFIEGIAKDPSKSPIIKICQDGGKVPPLKSTIDFIEKIESYAKANIVVEHDAYVVNMDVDGKFKKTAIEVLLTVQVNNLNTLFDAFQLDPTMRFAAHAFIKKESDKSEKAKLIVKLSEGKLLLNDMEITKIPTPDWDNILLPADVCGKYAPAPTTAAGTPTAPMVHTPY